MDPTLLAGLVAGAVTIGLKLLDLWSQRFREHRGAAADDRKLLSEDEREFRRTILEDLERLRLAMRSKEQEMAQLQVDLADCLRKHAAAELRIAELEIQVRTLNNR